MKDSGIWNIEFKKVDGSIRKMRCTRDLDLIPVENHPKNVSQKKEGIVTVWGFEENGWRSFREDSLISESIEK